VNIDGTSEEPLRYDPATDEQMKRLYVIAAANLTSALKWQMELGPTAYSEPPYPILVTVHPVYERHFKVNTPIFLLGHNIALAKEDGGVIYITQAVCGTDEIYMPSENR